MTSAYVEALQGRSRNVTRDYVIRLLSAARRSRARLRLPTKHVSIESLESTGALKTRTRMFLFRGVRREDS